MIKILRFTIFAFGFSVLLSGCKKESVGAAIEFAFLNIDNKTTYSIDNLRMNYNGQALNTTTGGFNNIKVPVGTGKLSLTDSTGKSLIDTSFTFEATKTINWVLFQPSNDSKPVLLENNGSSEPQPDAEHIKVKFANFVPNAFPKPFDIIFYWLDQETYEFVEMGRIDNIPNSFPDMFTVLNYNKPNTSVILLMLVDHESQEPLLDDVYIDVDIPGQKRINTLYISEDVESGSPVTGTPYKIRAKILFQN